MVTTPVVDAHVHLWDPSAVRYSWLKHSSLLNRRYLPDDYVKACGPLAVDVMVFVQAEADRDMSLAELDWVLQLAHDSEPRLKALVPTAPLELGDGAVRHLDAIAERGPLVRGTRRLTQQEPDDAFITRPAFVQGVQLLERYGWVCDLGVVSRQLPAVIELVRRCPSVRFVLDHIGKPAIRKGEWQPWAGWIDVLAREPNVWCKLSGVATEADWLQWKPEQLTPYIQHVVDRFGVRRTLYAGDWPVSAQATGLAEWVRCICRALPGLSASEQRWLFRDAALSCYLPDGVTE